METTKDFKVLFSRLIKSVEAQCEDFGRRGGVKVIDTYFRK